MFRARYKIMFALFACVLLTSCESSHILIPDGSGEAVKKAVLELCEEGYRTQLLSIALARAGMTEDRRLAWGYPAEVSYELWNRQKGQNGNLFLYVDIVDKRMEGLKLSLNGIRTMDQDYGSRRVRCAATLSISDGTRMIISYFAQYTDDGQLYVEVTEMR